MTAILGISAYYHDAAAALVVDGAIVAAAQEERFTRIKHDAQFPTQAIGYCLEAAGLSPSDLAYVGFYDKPLLKFDRLLETWLAFAPRGFRAFCQALPTWLEQKLYLPREMRRALDGAYRRRFVFAEHHESHAASAFFPSPFDEAAVLTLDGVGEWATASFGHGRGNRLQLTHELRFPHSLGLLYSAFTAYCGFKVNSGEYKLMGLAPYGEPKYTDLILKRMVDLRPDGSFRLDQRYFNYAHGLTMTSRRFHQLLGRPPRRPEAEIETLDMDLAASVQKVTEEILLRIVRHVHQVAPSPNLCLAGGVALNCVANGRLLSETPFENLWIQPAAGDAGGALGVALLVWHQLLGNPRTPPAGDAQRGSLLGPAYAPEEVAGFLHDQEAEFHRLESEQQLCDFTAEQLKRQRVVGWFQGRMEFGPRALGSRSILADPRSPSMQSLLNEKIKFRESFRPFAPAVLAEHAADYFDVPPGWESPYMLVTAPVHPQQRISETEDESPAVGLARLRRRRSTIPAVTHVDHSARVQTVDAARHPRFHRLLQAFHEQTGCPMLVNTSFNVRGEPIVCTPQDAYRCFLATDIDVLVMENFAVVKSEQAGDGAIERKQHLEQFALD
ncbi:MAG: carbamoyltransferase [Pirellulaceae bacterium]